MSSPEYEYPPDHERIKISILAMIVSFLIVSITIIIIIIIIIITIVIIIVIIIIIIIIISIVITIIIMFITIIFIIHYYLWYKTSWLSPWIPMNSNVSNPVTVPPLSPRQKLPLISQQRFWHPKSDRERGAVRSEAVFKSPGGLGFIAGWLRENPT